MTNLYSMLETNTDETLNSKQSTKKIDIYGDGEQIRDFIYVKDIANICVKVLESDVQNEIINFSTNKGVNLNELFDEMSRIYNYRQSPNYLPERAGDIKDSVLSNKKALEMFGDINFTNYKSGLKRLRECVHG